LEALGAQVNNHTGRNTVKRLEDENTKLRALLGLAGLSETWVEAYLKENNNDGVTANELQASGERSLPYTQDEANDYLETAAEATVS
jgi:hypothetical protein